MKSSSASRQTALVALVAWGTCAACRHDWSAAGQQEDAGSPDQPEAEGVVDAPLDELGAGDADGDSPADWSAEADAEPDAPVDESGAGDADAAGEDGAEDDAEPEVDVPPDRFEAEDAGGDEGTDAPEEASVTCGNGVLDDGEECDGDASRPCAVGMCLGEQECLSDCTWTACRLGAPPANDACGVEPPARIEDRLGEQTLPGTTCGARDDVSATCAVAGGPDVLFSLELRGRRRVVLDTTGSSFDAVLQVGGGPCPGRAVACDDDGAGGSPGQARLSLTLDAGAWWVVLDGAGPTEHGAFTLRVSIADAAGAPPNDECVHARSLGLDRSYRLEGGTTNGADDDAAACAGSGGADVWYRFSLGARTLVYIDVLDGHDWDSVLDVRKGSCETAAWTTTACGDDACGGTRSRIATALEPGTYYLVVDGKTSADRGDFTLRTLAAESACSAAEPITADGFYSGTTVGGSAESQPECVPSTTSNPEVSFYLPLCAGGTLAASTCNATTDFDTVLSLGAGSCRERWIACNDDIDGLCGVVGAEHASSIERSIAEPGLYFLVVDGADRGTGEPPFGIFGLEVSGL